MPKRPESDKRREMETYRKLQLTREAKSARRRQYAERDHLHMFIGGKDLDRPWLKVLRVDYESVWKEVAVRIIGKLPSSSSQATLDVVRPEIEREVYDILASRQSLMLDLDARFLRKNGRRMTPYEKSIFTSVAAKEEKNSPATTARKRADARRRLAINSLIQKIEDKHRHQPHSLQQAWAEIVGEEAAQDSILEKVDEQNGVALCRCMSSSLSFKIRRIKDLPQKLAKALDMNIRKVVFR